MPPKTSNTTAPSGSNRGPQPSKLPDFDDNEKNFFTALFLNLKNKPDIDWDAAADAIGFKNASTARSRYGQICRKHGVQTYTKAIAAASAASTPAKGRGAGPLGATPAKDAKGGIRKATGRVGAKGKGAATKADIEEDDDMKDVTDDDNVKSKEDDFKEI
ncbi:hypothetical protein ACHAQA_007408 [Verticillium albo-atrum]